MSGTGWQVCPACDGKGRIIYHGKRTKDHNAKCKLCKGRGRVQGDWVRCPGCEGMATQSYSKESLYDCMTCHGKGAIRPEALKYVCPQCDGKGWGMGLARESCVYVRRKTTCGLCKGKGRCKREVIKCKNCNGSGKTKSRIRVPATASRDAYDDYRYDDCRNCQGTGEVEVLMPIDFWG